MVMNSSILEFWTNTFSTSVAVLFHCLFCFDELLYVLSLREIQPIVYVFGGLCSMVVVFLGHFHIICVPFVQ